MKKALLVFLLFAFGWKPLTAQLLVHKIMNGSAVIDAEKKIFKNWIAANTCRFRLLTKRKRKRTISRSILAIENCGSLPKITCLLTWFFEVLTAK